MISDIFRDYGLYIYIGIGIIVIILIIIAILNHFKNKNKVEDVSSILDIDIDGVVDSEFKYGYEKEDTVVMKPVKKKSTKKKK